MPAESWIPPRLRSGARPKRAISRVRLPRRPVDEEPQRRHLIVCGDDPLAYRLVEELIRRYRVKVTVVLPSRRRNHGPQIARLPVKVVEADRLDIEAFQQAGIATADALALVKQDDVGNIHAALQAQELNARLRLVIRMFNVSLGAGIGRLFPDCRVLSDAAMATPEFVSAALGEVTPMHVRLPGRTLHVARRSDVRPEDVVCGLAATSGDDHPELLPGDQERADLVLAVADGRRNRGAVVDRSAGSGGTPNAVLMRDQAPRRRRFSAPAWLRRWRYRPLATLPMLISRKLRIAAVVLLGLVIVGTVVLKLARGGNWLDAAYLAILDTLAGANPNPDGTQLVKVTETILTIVSIALIPVITAAVVEAAVNARLALALGRLKRPISDHVVVAGLGNVGTRVIRRLHDLGVPVVAIDKDEHARGIPVARELGIPYIIGEASRQETLRAASVQSCRALVMLSTDDVTNLQAALQARDLKEDLRIVLRLFDGDFADRVQRAFDITTSRSVSFLAAPAFAAALLEREVVGTIPVGRKVLLLAEVPVSAGSELAGARLAAVDGTGEARVIALMVERRKNTVWTVDPDRRLEPDDVIFVVATREALGRLLARSSAPVP